MLDFINPSHPSEFAVLRLVAEAQEGGGDVFDIGRLCRILSPAITLPGKRLGWGSRPQAKPRPSVSLNWVTGAPPGNGFFMPINITECPMCFSPEMSWNGERRDF